MWSHSGLFSISSEEGWSGLIESLLVWQESMHTKYMSAIGNYKTKFGEPENRDNRSQHELVNYIRWIQVLILKDVSKQILIEKYAPMK